MLLRGVHGAGDNLEHVLGSLAIGLVDANGDSDHQGCAEGACGLGGNGSDEGAVGEAAGADLNRLEQAWESATGADGGNQRAFAEDDWVARGENGGNNGQRNLHVLELFGFEDALDEVTEAMIAG